MSQYNFRSERGRNHPLGKSHGGASTSTSSGEPSREGGVNMVPPGTTTGTGGTPFTSEDRITLVVDNIRFVVDPTVFTQYPNTMLGR